MFISKSKDSNKQHINTYLIAPICRINKFIQVEGGERVNIYDRLKFYFIFLFLPFNNYLYL